MTLFILPLFLGPTELILILLVVLLLFGGRKIPELMRGLGRGVKEFKDSSKEDGKTAGRRKRNNRAQRLRCRGKRHRIPPEPRARRRGKRIVRHERKTTASGAPPGEQTGKRDRIRATKAMYATRKTYRTA